MMDEAGVAKQVSPEMEQTAMERSRNRARNERWDLNILIFLFAILIIVIILLFEEVGIEIVAPVAVFGLAMVWLVGWRRGKELYQRFYVEELSKLEQGLRRTAKRMPKRTVEETEETIEEKVQKALRERWK